MSAPVALGHFRWICCNLTNRISTVSGDGIIQYVKNKMVLSGLIDSNDGGIGKGNGASDLEPGSIFTGTYEISCITHLKTTFVSVFLKKLKVRVSVLVVSSKVITLATREPGVNRKVNCGDYD